MIRPRSQNLIGTMWCFLWLALYDNLIFAWSRSVVGVSVQTVLLELDRFDRHLLYLLKIVLVIQAISENVAKGAECSFQSIRGCFFLCFLE